MQFGFVLSISLEFAERSGWVILYADEITASIAEPLEMTRKRREKQLALHNAEHGITPTSVKRSIDESLLTLGKRYEESEDNDLMIAESDDIGCCNGYCRT